MVSERKRRIVLGVTGSMAATKAQAITLALKHVGFELRVCMTYSACKIIQTSTISSVLEYPLYTEVWSNPDQFGEPHIAWAEWADAMVVAPATASCISSLWLGCYDNPVTLVAANMSYDQLYIAPNMAQMMWNQIPVQRNVSDLKQWGVRFLDPVPGEIASGGQGMRLMEPREIATSLDSSIIVK